MSNFHFIKDRDLRKILEDSVEYIYLLFEKSTDDGETDLFREETHRVIILYVISTIEAILLYFYKTRGEKMTKSEYRFLQTLPSEFGYKGRKNAPVVVAVQENIELKEQEITMHKLVTFFKDKKLIFEKTADDILELNDLRNTFHFSKLRSKKCDLEQAEKALGLLVRTIEKAPKALEMKK